ncbi:MAG: hypothetical protein RDU14_16600 [Melioribacteraceae bacterium]|nr:hypothetical protein [Melioribacteraceae bacterium]
MCEITTHGYKMQDGTIIPFRKLDMGDVSPEHVEEMNKSSASVWDVVLLRNTIFGFKDEIKRDLSDQIKKLTETLGKHGNYCPANEDAVKEIVHKELVSKDVKELMQKELKNAAIHQIDKGSKIIRYAWRVVLVIFVLLNIYLVFKGKSPIQITP